MEKVQWISINKKQMDMNNQKTKIIIIVSFSFDRRLFDRFWIQYILLKQYYKIQLA